MIFDSASTPRLWVKRLVIYESLHPLAVIRDIPLKRGLNLVVGKSAPDKALLDNPMAMAGHSVGKTTFCRLLRYCLGEHRFSTGGGERRIRSSLKHAWVGAEVEIEAVPWAVLRPLGPASAPSSAEQSATIEDLISTAEEGSGFYEFRQELEKLLPPYVHHPEVRYKWEHLLAWLARDQECRLRKFEEWRDSDSGSGTSGFRKPKVYPIHLVRGMLDLVVPEEAEWSQKYSDFKNQQSQLETQQNNARQKADFFYANSSKRLAEFIGAFPDTRNQAQLTFDNPSERVATRKNELLRQVQTLETALEKIDRDLFAAKRNAVTALEYENYISAMLAATPPPAQPETPAPVSEAEKNRQALASLTAQIEEIKDCPLAGFRPLMECTHLNEHLADLKKASKVINMAEYQRNQTLQEMDKAERLKIETLINQRAESKQILEAALERVQLHEGERQKTLKLLADIDKELDRLDRALRDFQDAEKLSAGGDAHSELQIAKEDLEKLDSEIHHAKMQLDFFRDQSAKRDEKLQETFDALVKRVLKANYSGKVVTSADDFAPQIMQSGEVSSGAAHRSLGIILLDIAAALGASAAIGKHPGFLVHDSPREADLDLWPYHSFLTELAALSEESGGENGAPFQYIITTTTVPPEGLEGLIRLSIAASPDRELLFRQKVTEKKPLLEA